MTKPVDPENLAPEDTPIEGTVFTPRQVGMLKVAVVVLGILLLAGFAAVIGGMIYQASKMGQKAPDAGSAPAIPETVTMTPADPAKPHAFDIPEGWNVVSMALDGDRLALHIRSPEDAEIVVVNIRSGTVVSRVKIEQGPAQ
ncbi:MAG: hypothetical protein PVJ46_03815 [Methyloceanibacter sp.]|jgi:hypothetical protein